MRFTIGTIKSSPRAEIFTRQCTLQRRISIPVSLLVQFPCSIMLIAHQNFTGNLLSDVFKAESLPANQSLHGVKYQSIHMDIAKYLAKLATAEIKHGNQEVFTRWAGQGAEFVRILKEEMALYAHFQFPYSEPIDEKVPLGVFCWWKHMATYEDGGQILPVSVTFARSHCLAI